MGGGSFEVPWRRKIHVLGRSVYENSKESLGSFYGGTQSDSGESSLESRLLNYDLVAFNWPCIWTNWL